jgi:hypothetical protein
MWIFWTCNPLFQDHNDVQCSMGYGLADGSQFSVQVLEEDFLQCTIMCLTLWVHKSGFKFWDLWKMRELSQL